MEENKKTDWSSYPDDVKTAIVFMTNMTKAFCRCCMLGIAIFDSRRNRFVCVSENFGLLANSPAENVLSGGIRWFEEVFDSYSISLFREMRSQWSNLIFSNIHSVHSYSISCDVKLKKMNRTIFYSTTPVYIDTVNGEEFFLCMMSVSFHNECSHIKIKKEKDLAEMLADSDIANIILDADISDDDKRIILLSARGMSQEEIANVVNKSVDTVKAHKKRLYKQHGISSMRELMVKILNKGNQNVYSLY